MTKDVQLEERVPNPDNLKPTLKEYLIPFIGLASYIGRLKERGKRLEILQLPSSDPELFHFYALWNISSLATIHFAEAGVITWAAYYLSR